MLDRLADRFAAYLFGPATPIDYDAIELYTDQVAAIEQARALEAEAKAPSRGPDGLGQVGTPSARPSLG